VQCASMYYLLIIEKKMLFSLTYVLYVFLNWIFFCVCYGVHASVYDILPWCFSRNIRCIIYKLSVFI
jgi:hypothetical protein